MRTDHCTEPDPPADPGGPTHLHHESTTSRARQIVASTDPVVGRPFAGAPVTASVVVTGAGTTLRASDCRFMDGAEDGVGVGAGGAVEIEDCTLSLTACGRACTAFMPGAL